MSAFDTIIDMVLEHEGGYVNHPTDPGGETKYGISKRAYPLLDIESLDKDKAKEIYRHDYWNKIRGDDLHPAVACVVVDFAVNSGVYRASKVLQRVCQTEADGILGSGTVRATQHTVDTEGVSFVVEGVTQSRLKFLQALDTYKTFGKGWNRRVEETHAKAMELI
jgi:lysozyme family protein